MLNGLLVGVCAALLLYLCARRALGRLDREQIANATGLAMRDDLAGMINETGEALETFSESGAVLVRGEEWKASAMRGIIEQGVTVRVVGYASPMVLLVEAIPLNKLQRDGDVR